MLIDNDIESYSTSELTERVNYQWFFCPKCKNIPHIHLQKDEQVEISCKCYDLEAFIIDEYGKLPMNELTRFQKYYMPLEKFIQQIKSDKNMPLCDRTDKHSAIAGEIYCTDCNKW